MKKNILLLLLLLVGFSPLFSQFNWQTELKIKNNLGFSVDSLYIGAKQDATDGLDLLLGEEDLPTMEPPQPDLFCFLYLKNGNETLWSYRDFRSVKTENNFKEEYKLYVNYGAGTAIDISWDVLGSEIDSAYIEDIFPDVDIFRVDMKKNQTVHIENHYSKDHIITIWYNKSGSDVVENTEKNDIFVYPNPAEDNILLKNVPTPGIVKIYNEFGTCVINTDYIGGRLNVSTLSAGVYFIKFNDRISRFIKL
ncbi:MAG: T9SS type A sorting domain-containing protein [bacterium]